MTAKVYYVDFRRKLVLDAPAPQVDMVALTRSIDELLRQVTNDQWEFESSHYDDTVIIDVMRIPDDLLLYDPAFIEAEQKCEQFQGSRYHEDLQSTLSALMGIVMMSLAGHQANHVKCYMSINVMLEMRRSDQERG